MIRASTVWKTRFHRNQRNIPNQRLLPLSLGPWEEEELVVTCCWHPNRLKHQVQPVKISRKSRLQLLLPPLLLWPIRLTSVSTRKLNSIQKRSATTARNLAIYRTLRRTGLSASLHFQHASWGACSSCCSFENSFPTTHQDTWRISQHCILFKEWCGNQHRRR